MALLEKDLEVKPSSIAGAGAGLFTKTAIAKGTRIVEYKGKVRTWHEVRFDHSNAYIYFLKPDYVIDARDEPKSLARYCNDAEGLTKAKGKKNNARFENDGLRVFLVATADIAEGEEIFVSYGKNYWKTVRKNQQLDKQEGRKKG